jgi:hypothetical protein
MNADSGVRWCLSVSGDPPHLFGNPCGYVVRPCLADWPLLPDDLDQYPLPPPAVEFPVEEPLPGTKDFGELSRAVEPAVGHRDHNLAPHHLPLQMGVGLPVPSFWTGVLTGAVMPILVNRRMRRQPFKPHLVIMM